MKLFDKIVDPDLMTRRINVTANHVTDETVEQEKDSFEQLDLFTDYSALEKQREEEKKALEKEKAIQHAMLDIKKKFGKNAILKGTDLQEGATTIDRNNQIGGHKA